MFDYQKSSESRSSRNGHKILTSVFLVISILGMMSWSDARAQEVATISHGPTLGRLGAHEIGVWARTFRPGTFWVRYGVNPDNLDKLSDPVTTTIEHDNTGWVHIKNLKANTKYYYALTVKGGNATMLNRSGSFRTLPDRSRGAVA